MMYKILLLNENNEFHLIIHAFPDSEKGVFQWYLTDNPNSEHAEMIVDEIYESIALSSEKIKNNYNKKWIYCHCKTEDSSYNEGCVLLSDNFIDMIRNNDFDDISFYDKQGNIRTDISYCSSNAYKI
jgi:hypothetical protein